MTAGNKRAAQMRRLYSISVAHAPLAGTVQARAGRVEARDECAAERDYRENDNRHGDGRHDEPVFGERLALVVFDACAEAGEKFEQS